MGCLSIYHMDIKDFVMAKSKNKDDLKHFNISVVVDDDFMKKVKNNEDYYVHHPVYGDDGKVLKDHSKWKYSEKRSAKEAWDLIVEQAYMTGEPGVLFDSTMNNDNNLWYIENINATNPCFTGDMQLLTEDGYITFKDLCDMGDVSVIDCNGNVSKGNKVWCSGRKEVIKLSFDDGTTIKCTPDHIFMIFDNKSECKAKNLLGKRVQCLNKKESKTVISIDELGKKLVYDFTENNCHWGIVNNAVVHNCGEYLAGTVYGENPVTHTPLIPSEYGGSCNLGSLILHKFVNNAFKRDASVDYDGLITAINAGVRLLDNVIDINNYPDAIYENYQRNFRTIGLGFTGLADMIAMMGMRYGSEKSIKFVDGLMDFITLNAYKASVELAKEKGSFPFLDKMKFINGGYLKKQAHKKEWAQVINDIEQYGIRNGKLISVAPTGTMSLVYGNNCSSGMEPIFSLEYDRKIRVGGQDDKNETIVTLKDYAYDVWEKLDGGDFKNGSDIFVTALELNVEDKINMLAKIANHVDMSVSNTLNIPEEYTLDQVKDVYIKSWELGIKGCTIFRPNKLRQGILFAKKEEAEKEEKVILGRGYIIDCSDDLIIKKRKLNTGCGGLHIIAGFDPDTGELQETYFNKGSQGGCNNFMNGLSRAVSLLGRAGVDIYTIVDQLNSTGSCPSYAVRSATKKDTSPGACCPMSIGNALISMYKEVQGENMFMDEKDGPIVGTKIKCSECEDPLSDIIVKGICPECGEEIDFEGGCVICKSCGYTKCG